MIQVKEHAMPGELSDGSEKIRRINSATRKREKELTDAYDKGVEDGRSQTSGLLTLAFGLFAGGVTGIGLTLLYQVIAGGCAP